MGYRTQGLTTAKRGANGRGRCYRVRLELHCVLLSDGQPWLNLPRVAGRVGRHGEDNRIDDRQQDIRLDQSHVVWANDRNEHEHLRRGHGGRRCVPFSLSG